MSEKKPGLSVGVSACRMEVSLTKRVIRHTACSPTYTFPRVKYHSPARTGELQQEHQMFGQESFGLVFNVKLKSNLTVKMYGLYS